MILLICGLLIIMYYYVVVKPYSYWTSRGIPYENPTLIFGSLSPVIFQKEAIAHLLQNIYNKHSTKSYVALYMLLRPTLILRDPELIKKIAINEFDTFPERTSFAPKEHDPLWAKNLFAMPGGAEWKNIRCILSPAYTKSKLKIMFGLMQDCALQFTNHFDKTKLTELEMKDTFEMAMNDIISTTAFGVSCNTLKNPSNEIFLTGKSVTQFDGLIMSLKFFTAAISPFLAKLLKIRLINEEHTRFFRKIIGETIRIREEQHIVRPDMIHLMMEARKGKLKSDDSNISESETRSILSNDVMTAQAVVFYFAGFDTTSTTMSYTAYELAVNQNIQSRLLKEIDETFVKFNNQITYEGLLEMKYLEMVISECLRKWPSFAVIDRQAVRSITLELDGKTVHLDDKAVCQIPVFAIHRDPKYFPNPEKFDPERFNEENKLKIKPFTYMPFGVGPRRCIGSRFALLSVKTVIAHLLLQFRIIPTDKTAIPLVLSKTNVNPVPADGFWLGLIPRNKNNLNIINEQT